MLSDTEPKKPTTLEEMRLTAEEEAAFAGGKPAPKGVAAAADEVVEDGIPPWAQPFLPAKLRVPRGRQVAFLRFKSAWTQSPDEGVMTSWPILQPGTDPKAADTEECLTRVIMVWTISDVEEHLALKATRGERERTLHEQTKRMLRAIDGRIVDWTGNWAKDKSGTELIDPGRFWTDLGGKCRQPLMNLYLRMHTLREEEMASFLLNGLGLSTAVAG